MIYIYSREFLKRVGFSIVFGIILFFILCINYRRFFKSLILLDYSEWLAEYLDYNYSTAIYLNPIELDWSILWLCCIISSVTSIIFFLGQCGLFLVNGLTKLQILQFLKFMLLFFISCWGYFQVFCFEDYFDHFWSTLTVLDNLSEGGFSVYFEMIKVEIKGILFTIGSLIIFFLWICYRIYSRGEKLAIDLLVIRKKRKQFRWGLIILSLSFCVFFKVVIILYFISCIITFRELYFLILS